MFQCKLFKLMLLISGSPSDDWSRYTRADKITQASLLSLADPKGVLNCAACSVTREWCLLSLGHKTSHPSSLNWCRKTVSRFGPLVIVLCECLSRFLQRWRTLAGGVWAAPSAKRKEWGTGGKNGLCLAYHETGMEISETGNIPCWAWACCLHCR